AWFSVPSHPERLLAALLRLFGLAQHTPLPFFRNASRAFADALAGPKGTRELACGKARDAFGRPDDPRKDAADLSVAQLYPDGLPLDGDASEISFVDAAQMVFEPFLRHRELRR